MLKQEPGTIQTVTAKRQEDSETRSTRHGLHSSESARISPRISGSLSPRRQKVPNLRSVSSPLPRGPMLGGTCYSWVPGNEKQIISNHREKKGNHEKIIGKQWGNKQGNI